MKLPMILPGGGLFSPAASLKQKLLRLAFQALMQGLKVLDRKIRKRMDAPTLKPELPENMTVSSPSALPDRAIPVATAFPDGTVSVYDEARGEWVEVSEAESTEADERPEAGERSEADERPVPGERSEADERPVPGDYFAGSPTRAEVERLIEEAYLRGKNEAIALQWDADLASMNRSRADKPSLSEAPGFPSVWDNA